MYNSYFGIITIFTRQSYLRLRLTIICLPFRTHTAIIIVTYAHTPIQHKIHIYFSQTFNSGKQNMNSVNGITECINYITAQLSPQQGAPIGKNIIVYR